MGDVRGVGVVGPGRGPSCSFSNILSAALVFRTGCLGIPVSLRLVGELRATSGLIEVEVGEGSEG